jgi:hypothetical protein
MAERIDAEYFFGPGVCGHPRQAQFFGTQPSVGLKKEGQNGLPESRIQNAADEIRPFRERVT